MARDGGAVGGRELGRIDRAAGLEGVAAAGVEAASRGRCGRRRDVALEHDALALALALRVRHRDRREERLGVGVLRALVHLVGRALFDDAAEVHHRDAVADVTDEREVVGDEEVGDAELLLQVAEQVDDVGLDRHVETADRLVEHEELGGQREGARDGDALQLAAGELARVAVAVVGIEAHGAQQLAHSVLALLLVQVEVVPHRLGEAVGDRRQRVERRERVLEHELHAASVRAHPT